MPGMRHVSDCLYLRLREMEVSPERIWRTISFWMMKNRLTRALDKVLDLEILIKLDLVSHTDFVSLWRL